MKKIGTILCLLLLTFLLEGCRMVKIKEADREPLKYTVVEKQQLPEEAAALIEEKKEKEFQMAYQRGDEMYLIKGYGRQMSGGYSRNQSDHHRGRKCPQRYTCPLYWKSPQLF